MMHADLYISIFVVKLTDQRDMLSTELSQATTTAYGNVESDEYRRLQAENAALKKSLGGKE